MRYAMLAALLLLAACTSSATPVPIRSGSTPAKPPTSTSHTTTIPHSKPPRPIPLARRIFNAMSEPQRVGQLLMVDNPTTTVAAPTITAITQYHVGSVILDGTSYAGLTETRAVTSRLQALAPKPVGLFIATDQEGGLVQRLQGPGFTRIASAAQQGTLPPATLQRDARGWGSQLHSAGVNVNLAPVLDTVPANGGSNPPIGNLDREFGHTPAAVTAHGLAFARGMAAAGVDVAVKHFPGLGRVPDNPDVASNVTDTVTTRDDPYLAPFRAAARAGVPFVMTSTAIYARIDPGVPAAFSRTIVTGMLREDLGYRGLILSDDLGGAKEISGYPIGERALRFVAAGGDVILTVDANQAATMTAALLSKAKRDPAFKRQVDAAALLVLQEKQARGLLSS